jgi:hypothetical protein
VTLLQRALSVAIDMDCIRPAPATATVRDSLSLKRTTAALAAHH